MDDSALFHAAKGSSPYCSGTLHKRAGRMGDQPIIGSGIYALNGVGGVSCSGIDKYFLRTSAASRIISRMEFCTDTADIAANTILSDISSLRGLGGVIVIDANGNTIVGCF